MEKAPEIELRGISAVRGNNEVLHGVNLSLAGGEVLFAMGGVGSGKSVLIKTAAGIALPAGGEVLYRGESLARMSARGEAAFRKASGFVFQDAALWSNLSLYDNLALPVRLHEPKWGKAEVERAVRRAVELVGFDQDLRSRPAELSTGERKLISLARALVLDPELLFMDDPTSNLDESSAERVPEIVDALKARGRSVFITSAASEFASRCADSVAVILGGGIAARGGYSEAAAWTEARVRGVTGRLKPRAAAAPDWAGGLAGAWVDAITADTGKAGALGSAEDPGTMSTLGEMINDMSEGEDEA